MTDTPLKPCPFCEGEAETDETIITDEFDEPTDAKECVVCCPECRIWFIGSTPAEAIVAWNRRPSQTYTQDQLDAAVRAERERCARIADEANRLFAEDQSDAKRRKQPREARDWESMRIASAQIAAAIRGGE